MAKTPEKSDGAFRTIREVADWLGVPTHVLRFWESKFDQIAPVKGAGGRRYYRPEDMRLLGGIKVMLHDQGLTIRAVSQKIEDDGVDPVMALSPELDMPDSPPRRTRRVIRHGDEGEAGNSAPPARPTPSDRAAPSAAPVDTPSDAPEEAPAPEVPEDTAPASPSDEQIPVGATPPQPVEPTPRAVQPDADTEGAAPKVETEAVAETAPADPVEDTPTQPAEPFEAPQPLPVDTPATDESDPLPAETAAPADPPTPEPEQTPAEPQADPADTAAPPDEVPATPVADAAPDETPPLDEISVPTLNALALARATTRIDPKNRSRLRRVLRRYRALADEIREDLAEGQGG